MGHIYEQTVDLSKEQKTPENRGEIEKSPWHCDGQSMYIKDKYARDRVMKSTRLLLPYLSQDDKNPSTILDVGCFTWEARKYFPRNVKYIGIDQTAYHKETRVMDLNHGFEPIPCSHALILETLEHLVDPQDALESTLASLAPEGCLVVSLPNEANLFYRIRCLLGITDPDCFLGQGKHLHRPSLLQSRRFLEGHCAILKELYYISPSGCNSKEEWVGRILTLIPDTIHQFLANKLPSLFARGFIFLCKKKHVSP